jgi:hypothetical protein
VHGLGIRKVALLNADDDRKSQFPVAAQLRLLLLTPEQVFNVYDWFTIRWRLIRIYSLACSI